MANTYTKTTTTKAALLGAYTTVIDAHAKWVRTADGSDYIISNTDHSKPLMKVSYTSANDTMTFLMHDGSGYNITQTLDFGSGGNGSEAVVVYTLVNDDRIISIFSTSTAAGVYTNNMNYFGYILPFDSTDGNAWGMYTSGAPEMMGKNFTNLGMSWGTLETMYMRAVTKYVDGSDNPISYAAGGYASRSTVATPFRFMDMEGYDGAKYGYNNDGVRTNIISGTPTFGGANLRDIFEEEKYLGSRVSRIGVYRDFDDNDGFGMRGTLDGVYQVKQYWQQDSNGIIIPKAKGMAPTETKILVSSRGEGFTAEDDWLIVPLSNKVNNFYIYNGLNVIAIPMG